MEKEQINAFIPNNILTKSGVVYNIPGEVQIEELLANSCTYLTLCDNSMSGLADLVKKTGKETNG